MTEIRFVLEKKPCAKVWTIGPDQSVFTALKMLADKDIGALLVMEGSQVIGIFSERDYARKVFLENRSSPNTKVREVMTSEVNYISPNNSTEEVMAIMTDRKIRHLPVMKNGRVVGIVSIGDVVKSALGEKEFLIEKLVQYITNSQFVPPNGVSGDINL